MDMKRLKNNMWSLLTESPEKPTEVKSLPATLVINESLPDLQTRVLHYYQDFVCRAGVIQIRWMMFVCLHLLAIIASSWQVVNTAEKPEVCGEKVFSQTTKMLLQRYQQSSPHASQATAVMRNNNDWIALKIELHANIGLDALLYIFNYSWSQD